MLPAGEEAMPRRVLYRSTKTMQLDKMTRFSQQMIMDLRRTRLISPRDISRNPRPDRVTYKQIAILRNDS